MTDNVLKFQPRPKVKPKTPEQPPLQTESVVIVICGYCLRTNFKIIHDGRVACAHCRAIQTDMKVDLL